MTIETSVESYLFTCVRCGARWTEDYQVSQVIDDAGAFRSFYRHHGTPCEAPVSGNIECPRCHATRARRDPLYGLAPELSAAQPAGLPLAVPAQRVPEGVPAPPQARISLTLPALLNGLVLILISSEAKRRTLEAALQGADLPVRRVLAQPRVPVRILWSP